MSLPVDILRLIKSFLPKPSHEIGELIREDALIKELITKFVDSDYYDWDHRNLALYAYFRIKYIARSLRFDLRNEKRVGYQVIYTINFNQSIRIPEALLKREEIDEILLNAVNVVLESQ